MKRHPRARRRALFQAILKKEEPSAAGEERQAMTGNEGGIKPSRAEGRRKKRRRKAIPSNQASPPERANRVLSFGARGSGGGVRPGSALQRQPEETSRKMAKKNMAWRGWRSQAAMCK